MFCPVCCGEDLVEEALAGQRLFSRYARVAPGLDRVDEVRQHGSMRVVREVHHVCAAPRAALGLDHFSVSPDPAEPERPARTADPFEPQTSIRSGRPG